MAATKTNFFKLTEMQRKQRMQSLASNTRSRLRSSPRAGKHPKLLVSISRCLYPLIVIVVALAIYEYLLYRRIHLIIQTNVDQGKAVVHLDDLLVPRTTPKARPKEAKAKEKSLVDVQQLANALTRSFSAEDGIASDDRMGFEISLLQDANKPTCRCDILSTDCLDAIACMQDLHNPQQQHAMIWIGIQLRRAIRATTKFKGPNKDTFGHQIPLGKLLQYSTIKAWTKWRKRNVFPEYDPRLKSAFVQEEWYPQCLVDHGNFTKIKYKGVSCLYQSPQDPEESAGTIIEDKANQWYSATIAKGVDTQKQIRKTLEDFFRTHQPRSKKTDLQDAAKYDAHFSPLGNLVIFAHISRMLFNRRPFLDKIFHEKLTSVVVPGSENSSSGTETNKEPYIVALHMRRGDSCGNSNPQYYQKEATPLYSKAQFGGERMCYQTHVYLDAVQRIRRLVPTTRPLHVYLATDDVGNVVHEILNKNHTIHEIEKKNMTIEDNIFGVDKWHFLNYSRAHFNYTADYIEAEENTEIQPILGETAIADLWLLSHGHAFVGHLGSRFGKVAWLLATARRNNFVPFFSVDGHSFCCEIDEACGKMKSYITVENCLSFGHEYHRYKHDNYWKEGSLARKKHFLEYQHNKKNETRRGKKQNSNKINYGKSPDATGG